MSSKVINVLGSKEGDVCLLICITLLSSVKEKINSFSEGNTVPCLFPPCEKRSVKWRQEHMEEDVAAVHWGFVSLKCYISLNFHDRFWCRAAAG